MAGGATGKFFRALPFFMAHPTRVVNVLHSIGRMLDLLDDGGVTRHAFSYFLMVLVGKINHGIEAKRFFSRRFNGDSILN